MKLKLDPIKQFALFLIVMAGLAIGFNPTAQVLLHLAATLGFGLILYWFYSMFSSKHKLIWNTVITSLIIFLVLDYGSGVADVIYPLIATFVAMTIKFFWEWKGSPVINPSVAGLLIMAGVVALIPNVDNAFISWWGASFQGWVSLSVVALWIIFGLRKWRKWPIVLTFLAAHAVLLVLRGEGMDTIQFILTDSTIYFLVAAMLIDPKTSPINRRQQMVYGLLAALILNSLMHGGAPYAEIFAIAAANIGFMAMRPIKRRKKKKA
jgi:hypothetical protein